MSKITITEALAEVPTIGKRIQKKKELIASCLYRQSVVRDPYERDGGAASLIVREVQAIGDLEQRLINIRSSIASANQANEITVNGTTRKIGDWLTWRREVAEGRKQLYGSLLTALKQMHQQANQRGLGVKTEDAGFSADYIVNINEAELAAKAEELETILGALDGQLSLKNATILIDVP